jgi:hypothetical protein
MNTRQANISAAHSLYVLYETLPENVQSEFLTELWLKKRPQLESIAAKPLTASHRKGVIFGIMEGALTVPDSFDDPLPKNLLIIFLEARIKKPY